MINCCFCCLFGSVLPCTKPNPTLTRFQLLTTCSIVDQCPWFLVFWEPRHTVLWGLYLVCLLVLISLAWLTPKVPYSHLGLLLLFLWLLFLLVLVIVIIQPICSCCCYLFLWASELVWCSLSLLLLCGVSNKKKTKSLNKIIKKLNLIWSLEVDWNLFKFLFYKSLFSKDYWVWVCVCKKKEKEKRKLK